MVAHTRNFVTARNFVTHPLLMATDFPTIGWLVALTVLFGGILLNSDFVLTYAFWLFLFWLFCKVDRIRFGPNAVL